MNRTEPQLIIRMGSHAEKDYIQKTLPFMDGIIVGANLLEATPGATASLLVKCAGAKPPTVPYYIDPMTYAFGQYTDPSSRTLRSDLDWIKSEQKVAGKTARAFKRSYRKLAAKLGTPFEDALSRGAAVTQADLNADADLEASCRRAVDYQLTRIASILMDDPVSQALAGQAPGPAAIFAPYFYIEPSSANAGIDLLLACARKTALCAGETPVHAVVCADESCLRDEQFVNRIGSEVPETGIAGVWVWFSKFHEDQADGQSLACFRSLIEVLSAKTAVYNMHGGFLSLALSAFGLRGVSHGVGYGEQKDVVPVVGQSTPTVRYYLPPLSKRLGVPQIERCFDSLGISTPSDFHEQICDCVVCKGVVSKKLSDFGAFGDLHYSTPQSKRLAQTPAAAKRCRFHFLLNRIRERDRIKNSSHADIVGDLRNAHERWSTQPSLADACGHLERWRAVLE